MKYKKAEQILFFFALPLVWIFDILIPVLIAGLKEGKYCAVEAHKAWWRAVKNGSRH